MQSTWYSDSYSRAEAPASQELPADASSFTFGYSWPAFSEEPAALSGSMFSAPQDEARNHRETIAKILFDLY